MTLNLIEAAPRVLPALPNVLRPGDAHPAVAARVSGRIPHARVAAVQADGVQLDGGEFIPAELVVWAAGIRSFACLQHLDGLEINPSISWWWKRRCRRRRMPTFLPSGIARQPLVGHPDGAD
ncbi:MAG: hypothetical protein R3E89_15200 [Thiolinea sp.]